MAFTRYIHKASFVKDYKIGRSTGLTPLAAFKWAKAQLLSTTDINRLTILK